MPSFIWVINHWLHITAAVAGFGGMILVRAAIIPALDKMEADAREAFELRVQRKLMMIILHSFLLVLITGFLNLMRVLGVPAEERPAQLYMALVVVKLFLALAMFVIAVMLFIPSEAFEKFQAQRKQWLGVAILAGLVVIFLSAWMRMENQYGARDAVEFVEEVTVTEPEATTVQ